MRVKRWYQILFFSACDRSFVSTISPKSKNGTFTAPVFSFLFATHILHSDCLWWKCINIWQITKAYSFHFIREGHAQRTKTWKKCKKYYPGLPQSRGTCLPVHIHLQVIFIKFFFPHKKLIQGASQRESADPLWGVQPSRHPSRVSPNIPSWHWCLICAMHNVHRRVCTVCGFM